MAFETKVALAGSEREVHPQAVHVGKADCEETAHVTVVLKRHGREPHSDERIDHDGFSYFFGAASDDIALVEAFAHHAGLTVSEISEKKRTVKLVGSVDTLAKAFGSSVACFKLPGGETFRGRTGHIEIPEELQECVVAVLGLDTRPAAKPHFRKHQARDAHGNILPSYPASFRPKEEPSDAEPEIQIPAGAFTPTEVAKFYDFPTGLNGVGQTVAIIELGGGFNAADLNRYFTSVGVHNPPKVTAVSVDGGQNSPGSDADGEVQLDIDVIGSIASGANIAVYFAPNTDQGFVDAITSAVHDTQRKPSVVSISWGGPEESWTPQAITAMNAALQDAAALGVTVTVAAGDDGSSDGFGDGKLHVDFPGSSPWVLCCGGTKLVASGNKIQDETVWNETANQEGATGGGVSNVFAPPSYQAKVNVPKQPDTGHVGRGVPDVAGDADPASGYVVRVDGQNQVIGGTSAVSPLYAALTALLNQKLGKPVGFLNPSLYQAPANTFRDVVEGDNDDSGLGYWKAKAGYDQCSGLGVIRGAQLLELLSK